MTARPDVVHILDVDPDLGRDLEPEDARHARQQLVARVHTLRPGQRSGAWGPRDARGHVGLMIVHGLVLRQLSVGRSRCAELLGTPDVVRPWDHDSGRSLPPNMRIDWEVLVDTGVAVLDRAFVRRAAVWPEVVAALTARGVGRAQTVAVHHAIGNLHRVDDRLVMLFAHLALRWGRVKTEGVVLELPLTHDLLARLTGAQRPSVTTALGQLAQRGLVRRLPDRRWLVPHSLTSDVATEPEPAPALG